MGGEQEEAEVGRLDKTRGRCGRNLGGGKRDGEGAVLKVKVRAGGGGRRERRGQRKGQLYFPRAMDPDDGPRRGRRGLRLFGFPRRRRPAGRHAQSEGSLACRPIYMPARRPLTQVPGSISRDIKVGIKTWIGLPSPRAALKSLIRGDI